MFKGEKKLMMDTAGRNMQFFNYMNITSNNSYRIVFLRAVIT